MPGEKILVIDDSKFICALFKGELAGEGYVVDSVLSGEDALEKAKSTKYSLIFVDMVLAGMDGVETCKALRKISPDSELIFMSGVYREMADKEAQFIEAGGKSYHLYKPFYEGQILEVTKKALANIG